MCEISEKKIRREAKVVSFIKILFGAVSGASIVAIVIGSISGNGEVGSFMIILHATMISLFIILLYLLLKFELKNKCSELNLLKKTYKSAHSIDPTASENWSLLIDNLRELLNYLNAGYHRKAPRLFHKNYGGKRIVILVPNISDRRFEFILQIAEDKVFSEMLIHHYPSFYNAEKWKKALTEWTLSNPKTRTKEKIAEFIENKAKLISMAGFVYEKNALYCVNDINECLAWDETYLEFVEKKHRNTHKIRSFVVGPVSHKGRRLGVMFIADSFRYSFYQSDENLIETILPIVGELLSNIIKYSIKVPKEILESESGISVLADKLEINSN